MEGDHLAKLEEGVDAWNRWRAASPTVEQDLYPDVSGRGKPERRGLERGELDGSSPAQLDHERRESAQHYPVQTVLKQAKLSRTAPWKANLRRANLSRADSCHAGLRAAD